ncbi:hypothetical protein BWI97_08745 [Siphonobacter sp. BAB-5405]|uniref:hypothetical protein n=1 Tax=Siphonobacter sp. BAB-5405 TaxID=1864825 RepID=UPI000C7FF91A|nr:hypothetical protein [Siphonobacter sp. BAB-5405]PMD97687.1 hypothetical protein BWI97_08745 [Siphonobacter sp. BAB-5405]
MKNFSFKEFAFAAFVFALVMVLPQHLFAALPAFMGDAGSFLSPDHVIIGMSVVSLVNIDGSSEGTPNPGGTRNLYIVARKDIKGVWPKEGDIVNGEIINPPVMEDGKKFAEYEFPDGTFQIADDGGGDAGYQSYKHTVDFAIAGFNKKLVAEMRKHLNTSSVIVAELNDGQLALAGSSDNGLYIKSGFKSGSKGNDKRGFTAKGEQDGFMWGIVPLAPAVAAALPLLSNAVPTAEEGA